ncbi:MAG: hypothetical protein GX793_04730 [Bacteroidales bacterium]|nr:hypothetical protein [Bacteroidales bacterium]
MENKVKQILLISILLILIFPFLQASFLFFKERDLGGAIEEVERERFRIENWFNTSFQKNKELYLNSNFGFRKTFIRVHNQIDFNLFKKSNAKGVVIGKDNYLYEYDYISAYYGVDFLGYERIEDRIIRLKIIQDSLQSWGKNLIVIFAPSKANFFPEYIPDRFKITKSTTNYEVFSDKVKEYQINHIDFNKYYKENKNKTEYPLYPQYGIHWSDYGSCLSADSIIRYIEKLQNIDMPNFKIIDYNYTKPNSRDFDILDGLNIFSKLKTYQLAYPVIEYEDDKGKVKPSSIVISDSFYWGMFEFDLITKAFSRNDFWYYNYEVFLANYGGKYYRFDYNLKKEIENTDLFIIMGTEPSLKDLGWGIIDQLYDVITEKPTIQSSEYFLREKHIRDNIKSYPEWEAVIEKQAIENNISLDSAITNTIIWLIENGE